MTKKVFAFFVVLGLFISCGEKRPDISGLKKPIQLNRLDKKIYSCRSKQELSELVKKERGSLDLFYNLSSLPSDTLLTNILWARIENPSIDSFYNQYLLEFSNLDWLEEECSDLFAHIKFYYPEFNEPKLSVIFSAYLDRDIVINESEIIISLDFFIGDEVRYKARLPEYMSRRYQPPNLVPMFLGLGLSQNFNEVSSADQSLLAEMIYYGKSHFFVSMVDPDLPDSINFGYSAGEIESVNQGFEEIWSYFVERDLLFTTNFSEINRYVGERPAVLEISPDCPGRIGRFIGYQIVKSYFENSGIELSELMQESDAQKIFRESGFNPSRVLN